MNFWGRASLKYGPKGHYSTYCWGSGTILNPLCNPIYPPITPLKGPSTSWLIAVSPRWSTMISWTPPGDAEWMNIRGFPKNRGTLFGVPIIRTTIYWGQYWGTLILGSYHLKSHRACSELLKKDYPKIPRKKPCPPRPYKPCIHLGFPNGTPVFSKTHDCLKKT